MISDKRYHVDYISVVYISDIVNYENTVNRTWSVKIS